MNTPELTTIDDQFRMWQTGEIIGFSSNYSATITDDQILDHLRQLDRTSHAINYLITLELPIGRYTDLAIKLNASLEPKKYLITNIAWAIGNEQNWEE